MHTEKYRGNAYIRMHTRMHFLALLVTAHVLVPGAAGKVHLRPREECCVGRIIVPGGLGSGAGMMMVPGAVLAGRRQQVVIRERGS